MELIEIPLDDEGQRFLTQVEDYFLQSVFIGFGIQAGVLKAFQSDSEEAPGLMLESENEVFIGSDSNEFTLTVLERFMTRPDMIFVFPTDRKPENYHRIPRFYEFIPRYTFHRWENPYLLNPGSFDFDENHFEIKEIDEGLFNQLVEAGDKSDFSKHFAYIHDYQNWVELGGGFGAFLKETGELVSLCSSLYGYRKKIEVHVTTKLEHQRKHLGLASAHHFLLGAIRKQLSPTWNCHRYQDRDMARQLGFLKEENSFMVKATKSVQ